MTEQITPGTWVTVEETRGWATPTPTRHVVSGPVEVDDEGIHRVRGVPVQRDANGYFPTGILVLHIDGEK